MPLHLPTKKKLIVCLSSLLAGCAQQPYACHEFTTQEKRGQYEADIAMAPENPLHAVIRDWERLCK